jgi:hypothetical protein
MHALPSVIRELDIPTYGVRSMGRKVDLTICESLVCSGSRVHLCCCSLLCRAVLALAASQTSRRSATIVACVNAAFFV